MSHERIDSLCERGILALVIAILCFGPLATGAVNSHEFIIIMMLTVGVMALWLVRLWFGEQRRLLCPPVCWPILGFAIYALARYFTADIEYVARWELLRVLVYVTLFFAVLNNLQGQENFPKISRAIISVGVCVALVAVWQFLAKADRVPSLGALIESWLFPHKTWYLSRIYMTRASGTYVNPNHLAGLLELLLPLALAWTMIGRGTVLGKILLGYSALVLLAGIGVSVSRGSWLATTLVLLVFFGYLAVQNTQRIPSLALMFFVVMGSTFFIGKTEFFQRRIKETFDKGVEQDTRVQLWDSTVKMWREHFWTGVGPAHYDYRFRAYRPEEIQLRPDRAHNEFLNLVADWGVVGAGIVLLAVGCAIVGVFQTWGHVKRPDNEFSRSHSNKFAFFFGTFFGLLAVLLHSAVDFNMQIPANAILVFCLAALLTSQIRHATDRFWIRTGMPVKLALSAALLSFAFYSTSQSIRLAREYRLLTLAGMQSWHSMAEIGLNQKAFAIEPKNFDTSCAIAEAYQTHSKQGGEDNAELATNAITWFKRGMELNPYDQRNFTGSGWCWDWLALRQDELAPLHDEAEKQFRRAEELDPKGYYTMTDIGYHFVQAGKLAAARIWMERSLRLQRRENSTAESYYELSNRRLGEAVTNSLPLLLR